MSYQPNIEQAKVILHIITSALNIKPEDLVSGRRYGDLCYARRLAVYLIRTNTGLKHQHIASLVGFKRQNNSIMEYRRVMNEYRLSQDVKADVIYLDQIINKKAS